MAEDIDQNDIDLDYVRSKRMMIIDKLTHKGVPEDTKELGMVLTALGDMDRVALGKKRIKTDVNLGNMQNQAMEIIAAMFQSTDVKKLSSAVPARANAPVISDQIESPIIIPGELDIGNSVEDFNSFTNRVK